MQLAPLTLAYEVPNPLYHVVDKEVLGGFMTQHTITLIIAGFLCMFILLSAVRKIRTGDESEGNARYVTSGAFAHMIESICVYLRNEVAKPQLGKDTDKFIGFLWTLFFFILVNNVLGLIPLLDLQHIIGGFVNGDTHWAILGGTATGNIAVTGALALIAFVVIQINGLRSSGLKGWAAHFLGGAPAYLAPIMLPVEILGMFIKPFALAIRLFANMVAGHTLMATILMFTGMGIGMLADSTGEVGAVTLAGGIPIAIVSLIAAVALMFLEIFVAFLQAFIFMFLVTIFIAQLMHHHHDDHEGAHSHHDGDESAVSDEAALVTQ